jgi:ATP-binding cassette subfamily A (ABC1) protein 3
LLLGHNDAGKTSTISMLTGLLEFTSDRVSNFGYIVQTQLENVRKSIGVFP